MSKAAGFAGVGLAVLLGMLVAACRNGSREKPPAAAPSWLAGLPETTVAATPGEPVWAVVPEAGSDAARLAIYRLEAVSTAGATLSDALGNRFDDVPGALVHPLAHDLPPTTAGLAPGSVVFSERAGAGPIVGKVTQITDGTVSVAQDWNGRTLDEPTNAAIPLPGGNGSYVMRLLAYRTVAPDGCELWLKGVGFAEDATSVWIREEDGFGRVMKKTDVEILDPSEATPAPSSRVLAHAWSQGFQPGTVQAILEPGLRYAVQLDGETEPRPYFFADLAEPARLAISGRQP